MAVPFVTISAVDDGAALHDGCADGGAVFPPVGVCILGTDTAVYLPSLRDLVRVKSPGRHPHNTKIPQGFRNVPRTECGVVEQVDFLCTAGHLVEILVVV